MNTNTDASAITSGRELNPLEVRRELGEMKATPEFIRGVLWILRLTRYARYFLGSQGTEAATVVEQEAGRLGLL